MRDPFFPPVPFLRESFEPLCESLSLRTLPLHVHEILFAFAVYHMVFEYIGPVVSEWLFSHRYSKLPRESKLRWNMHCVSLLQSITVAGLAVWVMLVDGERKQMDLEQRIWGYTGAAAFIQALATGYFLFDLVVMIRYLDVFGISMLAHASSCFVVYILGFRPVFNYYGCVFLLYELSTPFLNLHWFFDKLGMTGSKAQLYNGLLLLSVFFCCRLVWGAYASFNIYRDVWNAIHLPKLSRVAVDGVSALGIHGELPTWLLVVFLGGHVTLQALNVFWMSKMVSAVRKRFSGKSQKSE